MRETGEELPTNYTVMTELFVRQRNAAQQFSRDVSARDRTIARLEREKQKLQSIINQHERDFCDQGATTPPEGNQSPEDGRGPLTAANVMLRVRRVLDYWEKESQSGGLFSQAEYARAHIEDGSPI